MKFIRLSYSSAVLFWLVEINLGIPIVLSQTSLPFKPAPDEENLEFLPTLSAPPTFLPEEIPPQGDSIINYPVEDSTQLKIYRLDIDDQVNVSVPDFPEFNTTAIVDVEGNIFVPILGRISVLGLTLDEVQTKIRYELGQRFLKEEPEVLVFLGTPRPVRLTILGEVLRPGYYNANPNTPIAELLITAGGSTPKADLRAIIIRRTLVDGTVLEEKIDLYTPLITGASLPDFRLQGGDTVIVSKIELGQDTGYDRTLIARTTLTQQTITVRVLAPVIPAGVSIRNVTIPNGSTFLDVVASLPVSDRLRIRVNDIALLRFDPEKGGVVSQSLNPDAALRGDFSQNVPLEDQDVIIVSRTLLGEIFAFFNVITQPIRDISSFTNTIISIPNTFDRFNNNNNNNNNNRNR